MYFSSFVAPLAGAWVEIKDTYQGVHFEMSLPSRERGLKLYTGKRDPDQSMSLPSRERGLKFLEGDGNSVVIPSLPSRERGLKYKCHGSVF